MFEENFEKMTRSEQNQFQESLAYLLFHCYIVRRSFDKASQMNKVSPYYLFIERHFDVFSDYLSFAGIELNKDDENGVIFMASEDESSNKIRIDGVTTLLIFALRSYYEEKVKDNSNLVDVILDSTGLKILLKDLSLSTASRRISALTIQASLRTLSSYNIISLARGTFNDSSYSFYILPTIRYVISNARLNAIHDTISKMKQDSNLNNLENDEYGE